MVRKSLIVFSLLMFVFSFVPAALAASFEASVAQKQVSAGESFTLQLSLSGAGASDGPDLTPLEGPFRVISQGQSTRTSIINGKVSSSMAWMVTLMPQKEGKVMIPSISIATDQGTLRSQAFEITVVKPAPVASGGGDARIVFVQTELKKKSPYVNEPVLLTLKLVARKSIGNISIVDFTVPGAVVEQQGEAQVYDGTLNNQRVKVVEVKYLVTPLDAGPVTIPAVSFQGQVEAQRPANPLGNQYMDPFELMFNFGGIAGLGGWQNFMVSSEPQTLNVKPAAAAMDPWLPVRSLQITDQWDGANKAKVGEPLTRKIMIMADGASGVSLPSLQDKVDPKDRFKVYADSPTTGDKLDDKGNIQGWREESYTMIPQSAGTVTLPEITLQWWDLENDKIATASIPEKTITVQPGTATDTARSIPPVPQAQDGTGGKPAELVPAGSPGIPAALYIVVGGLGLTVLTLLGTVVYLLRQRTKGAAPSPASGLSIAKAVRPAANQDRISVDAIEKAQNAEDLRKVLQIYARQNWGMEKNAPLRDIHDGLKGRVEPELWAKTKVLFDRLDAALYAQKPAPVDKLRAGFVTLVKAADKTRAGASSDEAEKIGALNPS